MRTWHWLRETGQLYVRFVIAGAASIPVAVTHAYLVRNGSESQGVIALQLAAGVLLAALAWKMTARLYRTDTGQSKTSFVLVHSNVSGCNGAINGSKIEYRPFLPHGYHEGFVAGVIWRETLTNVR